MSKQVWRAYGDKESPMDEKASCERIIVNSCYERGCPISFCMVCCEAIPIGPMGIHDNHWAEHCRLSEQEAPHE